MAYNPDQDIKFNRRTTANLTEFGVPVEFVQFGQFMDENTWLATQLSQATGARGAGKPPEYYLANSSTQNMARALSDIIDVSGMEGRFNGDPGNASEAYSNYVAAEYQKIVSKYGAFNPLVASIAGQQSKPKSLYDALSASSGG